VTVKGLGAHTTFTLDLYSTDSELNQSQKIGGIKYYGGESII